MGTHIGNRLKLPIKIRQGIEATFITDLRDVEVIFEQQFTGMTNSYFVYKTREGFIRPWFKIATE